MKVKHWGSGRGRPPQGDGLVGVDIDRVPRVWDASAVDLALVGMLTLLAIATAVPVTVNLLRASEPTGTPTGQRLRDNRGWASHEGRQ